MKLTTTPLLLLLPLAHLISAAPTTQTTTFFTLIAARSASPIHFGQITANESGLWIGKRSSNYCPGVENQTCPDASPSTQFTLNNGVLGLGVKVEGGQQVYVDYNGKIRYTYPGDGYVPAGARISGWRLQASGSGQAYSFLSWINGTVFCPENRDGVYNASVDDVGPWQMYAQVEYVTFGEECLGASLLASGNETRANAYEYV